MVKLRAQNTYLKELIVVLLIFNIFIENIAPNTIYSTASILLFSGVSTVYILTKMSIKNNAFIKSYVVLTISQIVITILGYVADANTTINIIRTMLINSYYIICVYNILCEIDKNKLESIFIYTSLFSLMIVMILCKDELFIGRMAHSYNGNRESYKFFGASVSISSNWIASYSAFAFLFVYNRFLIRKRWDYGLIGLILTLGVVLTGSRKGILCILIFYSGCNFINNHGNKLIKLIKFMLIGIIIYMLLIKIPVLYTIIGKRLEALVLTFLGYQVSEGSISARSRYGSYAIEMIKYKPFLGYGLGYFKSIYTNNTENNYYELLVGGGIVALSISLAYVGNIIRHIRIFWINESFKMYLLLFVSIMIMQWGSVLYLSRMYLVFNMLIFVAIYGIKYGKIRWKKDIEFKELSKNE